MDKNRIDIKGLRVFAHHGVLEKEKEDGQEFILDLSLYTDIYRASFSDELDDTVNYAEVCQKTYEFMQENRYDLIEKAVYELSKFILVSFSEINEVSITLHKPDAPIDLDFSDVSVSLTNKWNRVYLGVGSNIGDGRETIERALNYLESSIYIRNLKCSELIKTEPYGYLDQPEFTNGAIELETVFNPYEMLSFINEIEEIEGRERTIHWGPRTLDLDILFYDTILLNDEKLFIPHVDMQNREFVLKPLMELCPEYVSPRNGKTVEEMYETLLKGNKDL